jgi:integrase
LIAWDRFVQHMLIAEPDLIMEMRKNNSQKYLVLDHMVQFWRNARSPKRFCQKRHPTTISTYFIYVKAWLKFNDIEIDSDKVKDSVKFPKAIKERVRGIDRDVIFEVYEKSNVFYRALLIFLSCTGMRVSEALNIEVSWIDFTSDPPMVTIPGQFTKTSQERITFLTPECVRHLNNIIQPDTKKIFDVSYQAVWKYFDDLRKQCGRMDRGANGHHHLRIHKLRGFAENKIARAVDSEYAHSILGHTKDLIQYNQGGTTEAEAAEDYKKAIPALTITTNHKLLDENEKLKSTQSEIANIKRQQEMMMAFLSAHPKLASQFRSFANAN